MVTIATGLSIPQGAKEGGVRGNNGEWGWRLYLMIRDDLNLRLTEPK